MLNQKTCHQKIALDKSDMIILERKGKLWNKIELLQMRKKGKVAIGWANIRIYLSNLLFQGCFSVSNGDKLLDVL